MKIPQTQWEESFQNGREYSPLNEILLESILEQVKNDKKNAIDLGCGTGDEVVKLAQRGMSVIGVDWSLDALKKAKIRATEAKIYEAVEFKEGDLNQLEKINLRKGKADLILCKLTIAFLDDQSTFLEASKSLLSKEGVLVLQTPVLHPNVQYKKSDKPGIAVDYEKIKRDLRSVFGELKEFDHSYYGEKGDLVTFIAKHS